MLFKQEESYLLDHSTAFKTACIIGVCGFDNLDRLSWAAASKENKNKQELAVLARAPVVKKLPRATPLTIQALKSWHGSSANTQRPCNAFASMGRNMVRPNVAPRWFLHHRQAKKEALGQYQQKQMLRLMQSPPTRPSQYHRLMPTATNTFNFLPTPARNISREWP